MLKKLIAICLIFLLLFLVGGCKSSAEDIDTEEEAQEAVVDVSEDISEISETLEGINKDLG